MHMYPSKSMYIVKVFVLQFSFRSTVNEVITKQLSCTELQKVLDGQKIEMQVKAIRKDFV